MLGQGFHLLPGVELHRQGRAGPADLAIQHPGCAGQETPVGFHQVNGESTPTSVAAENFAERLHAFQSTADDHHRSGVASGEKALQSLSDPLAVVNRFERHSIFSRSGNPKSVVNPAHGDHAGVERE